MSEDQMPTTEGLALHHEKSSKKRILSWALWDWGTQPYFTVITTFVFAVYITTPKYFSSAGSADDNGPSLALSVSTTIAGIVIALIAPVLGQGADRSGHLIRNLRWMTWALGLISMALFFIKAEPVYLIPGLVLLGVGSIIGEIAGSFYNASIDRIANEKDVGKVSGFGWGMGYIGGILVLLVIYFLFIQPGKGWFGDGGDAAGIRTSMLICGVWTLLFTIPAFLVLKDRPPRSDQSTHLGVLGSYKALIHSIVHLWKTDRQVAYFLLASALFRDGLAAVFSFGAVIAARSFGFSSGDVLIFGAAANLAAGVITMLMGLLDDKIGPKRVIMICLAVLAAGAILVFVLHKPGYSLLPGDPGYDAAVSQQGKITFWVLGLILSCFCGPAQAAARSFLARIVPEGHSGEIFGLYTTTGRVISFLSPALFGVFVSIGAAVTKENSTQHWGIIGIAIVLIAGLCVLIPVKARPRGSGGSGSTPPDDWNVYGE